MTIGKSLAVAILAASPCIGVTGSARAELPPRFTVWQDFAAIVAMRDFPERLGVVDRIERIGMGRFNIYGGNCAILATVVREPAKSPGGRPMPGPSRIVRVDLGEKQCKS